MLHRSQVVLVHVSLALWWYGEKVGLARAKSAVEGAVEAIELDASRNETADGEWTGCVLEA